MKKGDIVKIYQDPMTQNIPEGKARLIKKLDEDHDKVMEWWKVEFFESADDPIVRRWIAKDAPLKPPLISERGLMIGAMGHEGPGLYMRYFVLNPHKNDWHGRASRAAIQAYALVVEGHGQDQFSRELREWVAQIEAVIEAGLTQDGKNPITTEDPGSL